MAKLLSITWYKVLPAKFGGQKGIAFFNKWLARHYPLVCLCSRDNEDSDLNYKLRAELPVGKLQVFDPGCWAKIKRVALEEKATHIILEHPYHAIAALQAARATGAKLIVHSHNIESERFRQLGKWWWKLLRSYERWIHQHADLSLFKTATDMQYAIRHFNLQAGKCMLLPYGIDEVSPVHSLQDIEKLRRTYGILPHEKILLFAGTLDYTPNAKAVEAIYTIIAPGIQQNKLPYRIIICGRNRENAFQYLTRLSHPLVTNAGEVEDIQLYFEASDAFINPVIAVGGIQTKNIDALIHHRPVVSFESNMDDSIVNLAGQALFIAPDGNWEVFIQRIEEAVNYNNEVPRGFFEKLRWERIVAGLAERIRTT